MNPKHRWEAWSRHIYGNKMILRAPSKKELVKRLCILGVNPQEVRILDRREVNREDKLREYIKERLA